MGFDFLLPTDGNDNWFFDTEFGIPVEKTITYTATGNGAVGAVTLFTTTGIVAVKIIGKCNTTLTIQAGATIKIGTALTTAGLIAQTAGDAIDVNELWHDAAPDASVELTSIMSKNIISQDIIQTIGSDTIDAGAIRFMAFWYPMSKDGLLVSA